MNKIKEIFIAVIFFLSAAAKGFCSGYPVFDISNWLAAIDQMYAAYDQIQNTIKTIEQNAQQMQHMVGQARQLDWNNIEWDGDFDFRNEIKNVGIFVNERMDAVQRVKDCFNQKLISIGGQKFSYADLMKKSGWEMLGVSALKEVTNQYSTARDIWTGKLTSKQKANIWKKYGISPKNYYELESKSQLIQSGLEKLLGKADKEIQNAELQKSDKRISEILDKIQNTDGLTAKEISQYMSMLFAELGRKMEIQKAAQEEAVAAQKEIDMLTSSTNVKEQTKQDILEELDSQETRGSADEFNF